MSPLEVQGATVYFGGLCALLEVTFSVAPGTIHGLIGPNGAGKTTMLNCISRFVRPTRGSIRFAGRDLLAVAAHDVAGLGIARTFQQSALCPRLSALDNVLLGRHRRVTVPGLAFALRLPSARQAEAEGRREALDLLAVVGCRDAAGAKVDELPPGVRKRIELARALACQPALLLMDEPAAGLDRGERGLLIGLIRRVRDEGVTVLLVEHDVGLVRSLCDRVTVLDFGRVIAEGTPDEVRRNPAVVAAYLGEEKIESGYL